MADGPAWVKLEAGKWLVGTQLLDGEHEFVFWRLCLHSYERGTALVKGSDRTLAMMCKVTMEKFQEVVEVLAEVEKIERREDGIFIPSTAKRLNEALGVMQAKQDALEARQRGAKISRRRRELKQMGKTEEKIDQIISAEFPDEASDNQSGNQSTITNKQTNKQTDKHTNRHTDNADIQWAVDYWNELAGELGLSRCEKVTETRKKHLRRRLEDAGGLEGWKGVLNMIRTSDFLRGKNDKGWKADIDFMLRESKFTKVAEGGYQNHGKVGNRDLLDAIERI